MKDIYKLGIFFAAGLAMIAAVTSYQEGYRKGEIKGFVTEQEAEYLNIEGLSEIDLAWTCILQIVTSNPTGEICVEADGSVTISGEIDDVSRAFWEGLAQDYPYFIDDHCRHWLIGKEVK